MQKEYPQTQAEARQYAIDWQNWQAEQILSFGELSQWALHFETIAKQFNLIDEFKENGII